MEDSQEHTVAIAEFHTAAGERCQLQLTATRVPEHLMPVHPMHICAEK